MHLSKSDYVLGISCEKALWLKIHEPQLVPDIDIGLQRRFDIGNEVQKLARLLYPEGHMVADDTIELDRVIWRTQKYAPEHSILFEAAAKTKDFAFCRIDIMEKNGTAWNLIEIKSATEVKDEYIDDLAFQKYVFESAGYPVSRCKVIYLNNEYERIGDLDIQKLFKIDDVTEAVNLQYPNVPANIKHLQAVMDQEIEPKATFHKSEPCKECAFKAYCRQSLPEYSIFNLFNRDAKAQEFYNRYQSCAVEDIPPHYDLNDKERIDRDAYLTQKEHFSPAAIKEWLNTLVYPLYYLDYETAQLAVPLFDHSHPYDQIPFQFSLHIQEKRGGEVKHIGFLHHERSDPRRDLAEALVENCGNTGSVIVYNQAFEMTRNDELAELFPDLSSGLENINKRVVDQLIPFRKRYLYSPKQNSSASIKYVLPAFCDLSYKGMEIANGTEAMCQYQAFLENKQTPEETARMFAALEKYCAQDTLAMVKLMEVLYNYT